MKKSTVLSLTAAAVILAAYVPNEVVLADTSNSEDALNISDKEKVVVEKETENKEKHENIPNAIETSKDTEEKKTTIIEEKEVVSKNPEIDNKTSNEEATIKEDSNQSQGDKADSSASKDPESPKKRINLSILLNLKIKHLEKKQSRNYPILRIQKFYILMIGFLTVVLLKQPQIIWTKLN